VFPDQEIANLKDEVRALKRDLGDRKASFWFSFVT